MNSSETIWSIRSVRELLLQIDNCVKEFQPLNEDDQPQLRVDGTPYVIGCSMAQMCPECVDKFAGLLEWAEDLEQTVSPEVQQATAGALPS